MELAAIAIRPYEMGYYLGLKNIMDQAEVDISFLGMRYITAKGYQGFLPLEALVLHIRDVIITKNFNIKVEDRPNGRLVSTRITQLYKDSDGKLQNAWRITQLFCWFRELISFRRTFVSCRKNTKEYWEGTQYRWFDYYTKEQHKEIFNIEPEVDKPGFGKKHDYEWYSSASDRHPRYWHVLPKYSGEKNV